jgi:hypothetical protein
LIPWIKQLVKDKSLEIKPLDASPRDPREGNKKPLSKKQEGSRKYKQDLVKRIGVSSQAILLGSWVHNSMTLPPSDYHARAATLGCMAEGKGVSSRANLLISAKLLVGNTVNFVHHAKVVSSG